MRSAIPVSFSGKFNILSPGCVSALRTPSVRQGPWPKLQSNRYRIYPNFPRAPRRVVRDLHFPYPPHSPTTGVAAGRDVM